MKNKSSKIRVMSLIVLFVVLIINYANAQRFNIRNNNKPAFKTTLKISPINTYKPSVINNSMIKTYKPSVNITPNKLKTPYVKVLPNHNIMSNSPKSHSIQPVTTIKNNNKKTAAPNNNKKHIQTVTSKAVTFNIAAVKNQSLCSQTANATAINGKKSSVVDIKQTGYYVTKNIDSCYYKPILTTYYIIDTNYNKVVR